jgi:hypothetical protein
MPRHQRRIVAAHRDDDGSKWLAPSWEWVFIGFVLSAIFTFAISSKKTQL